MKLVVTIDTEEDDWGCYHPTEYSVKNIARIPELQDLFNQFGICPTYLIDYPVAATKESVAVMTELLKTGRCEIGMQCHPWNTPPFEEENNKRNTMLCNLPPELQFRKLSYLHQTIIQNFNIVPIAFRAGRWGYSGAVASGLEKLGYKIDTSVMPYVDWREHEGPDFSNRPGDPYFFKPAEIYRPDPEGSMLEVPPTIGYTQSNSLFSNELFLRLSRPPFRRLRLIGLFHKLGWLNKVWLSPEKCTGQEMIALTKRLIQKNQPVINLFFHSPTLQTGLTPYARTEADRLEFLSRLKEFLLFSREAGIEPIRLSETLRVVPK